MIDEAPSLYELLPRYIRFRDQSLEGAPLEVLMSALQVTFDELHTNIDDLWDAWFIETCAPWLVPYIGDLLGVRGLDDPAHNILSQRAQVANTLAFRRRRGTLAVLEEAGSNATGWATLARDLRKVRAFTQHVDAVQLGRGGTLDLREEPLPFQAEVIFAPGFRNVRISGTEARCLRTGVELALGEVFSYPVTHTFARPMPGAVAAEGGREARGRASRRRDAPRYFKLSPWGIDIPLFQRPTTPYSGLALRQNRHLPLPIGRTSMQRWLRALAENQAIPETLGSVDSLYVESGSIGAAEVWIRNLSHWLELEDPSAWPPGREMAIDPRLGRIAFRRPRSKVVPSAYTYGAMMDLGGGPYERQEMRRDSERGVNWRAIVFRGAGLGLAEMLLGLHEPECIPNWAELCLLALVEMSYRGKPENPAVFDSVRQALDFWGYHHRSVPLPPELQSYRTEEKTRERLQGEVRILDSALYPLHDDRDELESESPAGRCAASEPYRIPLCRGEGLYLVAAQGHCPFLEGRIEIYDAGRHTDDPPAGEASGSAQSSGAETIPPTREGGRERNDDGRAGEVHLVETGVADAGLGEGAEGGSADGSEHDYPGLAHLDGLWLCGGVGLEGEISLDLVHCTLNPPLPDPLGAALTEVETSPRDPSRQTLRSSERRLPVEPDRAGYSTTLGRIWIERSILGPILLRDFRRVLLIESLVDVGEADPKGLAAGPPTSYETSSFGPILEVESSTFFGQLRTDHLDARNSLFADQVFTRARRGRLDSCYLPRGSATGPVRGPRGPATGQPADAGDAVPLFISRRFGDPGYAALVPDADERLLTGADDGGEIGVFHALFRAQRQENLNGIWNEYLPWGCFVRSFYMTPDTGIWRYRRGVRNRRHPPSGGPRPEERRS